MSIAFLLDSDSSAVIWRGPRKHSTVLSFLRDVYWSKLDYLICDTPPGTSDEHMTVVTALKDIVDGAILVSTPSAVAVSTLGKELDFCKKLKVPILGIIENMKDFLCPCCGRVEPVKGKKKVRILLKIFPNRFFLDLLQIVLKASVLLGRNAFWEAFQLIQMLATMRMVVKCVITRQSNEYAQVSTRFCQTTTIYSKK